MKKLFFALIMFLSLCVTAQVERVFIDEVTEEMDAYIHKDEENEGYEMVIVKAPSYYDLELVMMSVKLIANKYSDVTLSKAWRKDDEISYTAYYRVAETLMLITYYTDTQFVLFLYDPN